MRLAGAGQASLTRWRGPGRIRRGGAWGRCVRRGRGCDRQVSRRGELDFLATAAPRPSFAGHGDDGVIALAMHDARAGGFFERADGQESFDKDFEEFDEATVFLHGDDERFVFVAEMMLP